MGTAPGLGLVKHVIAVASGKGGVGKSTVTTNLALALKKSGFKVGLMDADLYGPSQPGLLGSEDKPIGQDGFILPVDKNGLKFISMGVMNPSGKAMVVRAPLAIKAISQFLQGVIWSELDFLLIDLPPGTGDIQLTLAQQARLSGAIIVTTPQRVASEIARKGAEMFEAVNVPILGIVENMSGFACVHCGQNNEPFKKGGGEVMAKTLNVPFLVSLPLDPDIMMSGDEGINIIETKPNSHAAQAFNQLAKLTLKNLESAQANSLKFEADKIETNESILRISWKDGAQSEVDAFTLRTECPCASCVDENTGKRILRPDQVPLTIRATQIRPVGRYGLSITFSDGHNTGIYKFTRLKEMKNTHNETTFSV